LYEAVPENLFRSYVRGLTIDEATTSEIKMLSDQIRKSLQEHVFPMIERWVTQVAFLFYLVQICFRRNDLMKRSW